VKVAVAVAVAVSVGVLVGVGVEVFVGVEVGTGVVVGVGGLTTITTCSRLSNRSGHNSITPKAKPATRITAKLICKKGHDVGSR
jgi:hypothetical protein